MDTLMKSVGWMRIVLTFGYKIFGAGDLVVWKRTKFIGLGYVFWAKKSEQKSKKKCRKDGNLQAFNIYINKSFKRTVYQECVDGSGEKSFIPGDSTCPASLHVICLWIIQAWNKVKWNGY